MATQWIIWLAVGTHLFWGYLLLSHGEVVSWITAIHFTISQFGFSYQALGLTYCGVAIIALVALFINDDRPLLRLGMMLPQQFFLCVSLIGAFQAVRDSQFADGVIRPRAFLAADQIPFGIMLTVGHTCAILEPFVRSFMRKSKWSQPHGIP